MSTKVAFTGWNSLQSGWNTSTWGTSLPFSLTATGSVGLAALEGDAIVAVTGVAGTAALCNIFSTNVGISATASVNGATAVTVGNANISVVGVTCTAVVGNLASPPWGQIIPDQNPNFLNIAPSQNPSWANLENGLAA